MRPYGAAAIAFVALGLLAVQADVALADDPLPPVQSQPRDSPYLLQGDRAAELNFSTTLQLDWNGLKNVDGPTAHAGALLGAEVGLPFVEQRVRPALFTGFKMGAWADEVHGPFGAVEGARIRLSPFMWDIFDIYFVAHADFDLQLGQTPLFRPGAGIGLRAARLVAVEATWDVTVPMGSSLAGTRYPDLVPFGVSFGVAFDACFGCNRAAPPQVQRDLACRLYHAAATHPGNPEICGRVNDALSAVPPVGAPREKDGTAAFLADLATRVKTDAARETIASLVDLHAQLTHDWTAYEE
ncbi:MAG: hypothetical protein ACRENE_30800, partial [Polyangiaceae bacterium]